MPASKTSDSASASRSTAGDGPPVWLRPKRCLLFLLIVAVGLAGDLVSKHMVFSDLLSDPQLDDRARAVKRMAGREVEPMEMLAHLRHQGMLQKDVAPGVDLTLSLNPGVVFGLRMNPALVSAATAVTVLLVVGIFLTSPADAWGAHAALALILAGALGNWYDRLFGSVSLPHVPPIRGHVRDFIDLSSIRVAGRSVYPWVFNVADIYLVVGVGVLLVVWLIASRRARGEAEEARST